MRRAAPIIALCAGLVLALMLGLRPATADVGASGTRLSVGSGPVRFYMTYGHIEDQELWAPIIPALQRIDVTFTRNQDTYSVFHKGKKVADWDIVTSRDDIPETAETPVVLALGGNIFVPVRALSEQLGIDIKWTKGENIVALVPSTRRPVAQVPPVEPAAGLITLTGVELRETPQGVQIRILAAGKLKPTWLQVKLPPVRVAIDLVGAMWATNVKLAAPIGNVKALRTGHPEPGKARLTLEVPGLETRVTSVRVDGADLLATVGEGTPVATAPLGQPDPIPAQRIPAMPKRLTSRSALPPLGRINLTANSLLGRVICVDAGHGGHSSGAKGLSNLEKDLCLRMALEFRDQLVKCGARVIMTRDDDTFVSLEERVEIASRENVDLFISVHCNSTPRRNSANGSQTYYTTPQSLGLAQAMHRRLVVATGLRDGGIRPCRFYVCRNVRMPSVLLEVAFINNAMEEKLLSNTGFHATLGMSLAMGVIDYFTQPGLPGPMPLSGDAGSGADTSSQLPPN